MITSKQFAAMTGINPLTGKRDTPARKDRHTGSRSVRKLTPEEEFGEAYAKAFPAAVQASAHRRAKRGTGAHAVRKASVRERTPDVLKLLGLDSLPEDVEVKAKPHQMNGLERAYAQMLDTLQFAGEVVAYDFEPVRLHIGLGRCWMTPDFFVRYRDGRIEAIDTKGQRHASGIRGMRTAAKMFPAWRFRIVKQVRGGWVYEEICDNGK